MTTLDGAFGDVAPAAPGVPAGSLDDAFAQFERERKHKAAQEAIRQSLTRTPPTDFAKSLDLSRQTAIPRDVVGRNMSDVERKAQVQTRQQQLAEYQALSIIYANYPDTAALIQNDLGVLGEVTRSRVFRKKPTAADFPLTPERGFKQAGQELMKAEELHGQEMNRYAKEVAQRNPYVSPYPVLSEYFGSYAKGGIGFIGGQLAGAGETANIIQRSMVGAFADLFLPEPLGGGTPTAESLLGPMAGAGAKEAGTAIKGFGDMFGVPRERQTLGTDVLEGIGQLGTQIAQYIIAPGLALPGMYAQGVDQVEAMVKEDPASQGEKDLAALLGGVVTVASEKFSIDKILERIPPNIKNSILQKVADVTIAGGIEAGQEWLERLGHETAQHLLTNPDAPWLQGIGREMTAAGLSAALIRGLIGGNIRKPVDKNKRTTAESRDAAEYAEGMRAAAEQVAQTEVAGLGRDGKAAIAKTLQAADPDSKVTIDAKTFSQVLEQSGIPLQQAMEEMPSVADQYVMAAARGGDLVIPTGEFLSNLSQTPAIGPLIENIRQDPEAMTLVEANTFFQEQTQEFMRDAERVAAEKATDVAWQESKRAVETEVRNRMDAVGAYSRDVNRKHAQLMAAFYETLAAKEPTRFKSPGDAMAAYPTVFQNGRFQAPGEGAFEQQDTQTPEFQQWFARSVLQDETGKPTMLFHGTRDDVGSFDLNHPNRKDTGWLGTGVSLTDSPDLASTYANIKRGPVSPNVMPLYARIENPYMATLEDKRRIKSGGRKAADAFTAELKAKGHDGVILQFGDGSREITVFDPAAVKSVFNRRPGKSAQLLNQAPTREAFKWGPGQKKDVVEVKTVNAKTGRTMITEESTEDATSEVDDRISRLQELIKCLG